MKIAITLDDVIRNKTKAILKSYKKIHDEFDVDAVKIETNNYKKILGFKTDEEYYEALERLAADLPITCVVVDPSAAAFIALTIGGEVTAATRQDNKTKISAKKENELAKEKVNKGEYRGTKAEIDAQMRKEFAKKLPEMLEEAYQTMENGKQETMTLTVKKGENGLYTVDIGKFLIKIMDLSTKED